MASVSCAAVRVIVQQCLSARLQVQPASQGEEAQWVEVGKGIVIYICFLKGSSLENIPKVAKSILNVKLSESADVGKNVSVLDLPGDILIVPQATLGGKMKGKNIQYHSNIAKEEGLKLYEEFIFHCKDMLKASSGEQVFREVKHGTYGNRQVLSISTNGPFTHVFDF